MIAVGRLLLLVHGWKMKLITAAKIALCLATAAHTYAFSSGWRDVLS